MMVSDTVFIRRNLGWNAEPNAPCEEIEIGLEGTVSLSFLANTTAYPQYETGERLRLEFVDCRRCRLTEVNDEGWYSGRCRFSKIAPEWGEFYEVLGDFREAGNPTEWRSCGGRGDRNFLFYLRDNTFEATASGWGLLRRLGGEMKQIAGSADR